MINVPIPQLIAALNFVFGRLLAPPFAAGEFRSLRGHGFTFRSLGGHDVVEMRRFCCSELSSAGRVIMTSSSPRPCFV